MIESIAWITLGFLPMFGSMELAWRLSKRRSKKTITALTVKTTPLIVRLVC